jgi:hypothetical protein
MYEGLPSLLFQKESVGLLQSGPNIPHLSNSGGSRNSLRPGPLSVIIAKMPPTAQLECIDKPKHRWHAPGHGPGCQGPRSAPERDAVALSRVTSLVRGWVKTYDRTFNLRATASKICAKNDAMRTTMIHRRSKIRISPADDACIAHRLRNWTHVSSHAEPPYHCTSDEASGIRTRSHQTTQSPETAASAARRRPGPKQQSGSDEVPGEQ